MRSTVRHLVPWALLTLLLLTGPAFAHHALGGRMPSGFTEGLVSGLAHPIINIDHFAFVIAVGVLTAVAQGGYWPPVWFVGGTIAGCVLSAVGLGSAPALWLVPVSAILLGGFMASGRDEAGPWMKPTFLIAGLLHGFGYAEAIIGSENTSLQGYLIGFAIVQTLVAWGAMLGAYWLWRGDRLYINARVLGGVLAGVGLTGIYQAGLATLLPVS